MSDDPRQPKPATAHTAALNAANAAALALDDVGDLERASRGLIAQHETGVIDGPIGPAWDVNDWDFMREQETPPPSVHPSLWRHGRLNAIHGLFEVADGVWQARGLRHLEHHLHPGRRRLGRDRSLTTSFTAGRASIWPTRRWASVRSPRSSTPTATPITTAGSWG